MCETQISDKILPKGVCYPLLELTSISLKYCPTYPKLACMRVNVHVFSLQMSTGFLCAQFTLCMYMQARCESKTDWLSVTELSLK